MCGFHSINCDFIYTQGRLFVRMITVPSKKSNESLTGVAVLFPMLDWVKFYIPFNVPSGTCYTGYKNTAFHTNAIVWNRWLTLIIPRPGGEVSKHAISNWRIAEHSYWRLQSREKRTQCHYPRSSSVIPQLHFLHSYHVHILIIIHNVQ